MTDLIGVSTSCLHLVSHMNSLQSCPFQCWAHNRIFSCQSFPLTYCPLCWKLVFFFLERLFGLGKGGRAEHDAKSMVHLKCSFSPGIIPSLFDYYLFNEKSQDVLSPISASELHSRRSGHKNNAAYLALSNLSCTCEIYGWWMRGEFV